MELNGSQNLPTTEEFKLKATYMASNYNRRTNVCNYEK